MIDVNYRLAKKCEYISRAKSRECYLYPAHFLSLAFSLQLQICSASFWEFHRLGKKVDRPINFIHIITIAKQAFVWQVLRNSAKPLYAVTVALLQLSLHKQIIFIFKVQNHFCLINATLEKSEKIASFALLAPFI